MDDIHHPDLKREHSIHYGHAHPAAAQRMQPAETVALHNTYPPAVAPTMANTFTIPQSPYESSGEHRPHPSHPPDASQHPPPYPPTAYAPHAHPPPQPPPPPPPPPAPVREHSSYDTVYSRPGSISGPSRSPAEVPQPPPFHAVNGGGPPEGPYYSPHGGPPPDNRPRYAYGPSESPANGTYPPPGLHVATGHDMMAGQGPLSAPYGQSQPPTPMYGSYYPQGGDMYQRRKPVRAAQACDSCRQRKAKCDEGRPECSHCKDNGLKCTYREVPQPKQEKQVLAINDKLEAMNESILTMLHDQQAILDEQKNQSRQLELLQSLIPESSKAGVSSAQGSSSAFSTPAQPVKKELRPSSAMQAYETDKIVSTSKAADDSALNWKHSTAAQNIMLWPSIRSLIPVDHNYSYVMDLECSRGLLRLYGIGEGEDKHDYHNGIPSPATSNSSNDRPDDSPSPGGSWGSGHLPTRSPAPGAIDKDHAGGVSVNGGLVLEAVVVDRYVQSYNDNMYILHPFLDKKVLKEMVHNFKRRYSWDYLPFPHRGLSTGKRKREMEESPPTMSSGSPALPQIRPPPRFPTRPVEIEHSIANAIVLLVIALGKICAHKSPLPGPLNADVKPTSTPHTAYADMPMSSSAPNSPYRRTMKPGDTMPAPVSLADGRGKNMDVIPGLAYFARAADILGELPGGTDVSHVQANLLAGLYMGQLARIMPSHYYISNACKAIMVMIESTAYKNNCMHASKRDLVNTAFWSCLQLESDILAEVELPPSGISRYEAEQLKEMPNGLTLNSDDPTEAARSPILYFYSSQVQLRRTLNEIRSFLYRKEPKALFQRPSQTMIETLNENLDGWRGFLAPGYAWEDAHYQSTDVNAARMRGKYYGAKYTINRPALSYALAWTRKHGAQAQSHAPASSQSRNSPTEHPTYHDHFPSSATAARSSHGLSDAAWPSSTAEALEPWVLHAAKMCVEAAIRSTTAFDAVPERLIITNIFGTAHAQFGNMLVLSATWYSDLRYLVDHDILQKLFDRTIRFLKLAEAISPTLAKDAEILIHIRKGLFPHGSSYGGTMSHSSSFSVQ